MELMAHISLDVFRAYVNIPKILDDIQSMIALLYDACASIEWDIDTYKYHSYNIFAYEIFANLNRAESDYQQQTLLHETDHHQDIHRVSINGFVVIEAPNTAITSKISGIWNWGEFNNVEELLARVKYMLDGWID